MDRGAAVEVEVRIWCKLSEGRVRSADHSFSSPDRNHHRCFAPVAKSGGRTLPLSSRICLGLGEKECLNPSPANTSFKGFAHIAMEVTVADCALVQM